MNLTLTAYRYFFCLIVYFILVVSVGVKAQSRPDSTATTVQQLALLNGLFSSDNVLELTLKGSVKELLNDREDKPATHPLSLVYKTADGVDVSLPIEGKTRGHFRKLKENCNYPPILLQFKKGEAQQASIFKEQVKMKLVMPCLGDDYVVREWLVYKLYNLISPESFKARLVKVSLDDNNGKKIAAAFYGILLEEEKQMAKRNGMVPVTRKLKPAQILQDAFLKMAVFEYLIGNTDWSVEYLQNIKIIASDSLAVPIAVPYDFDHAGIVNAPYAKPAEELMMYGIRERRYRGYCVMDMKVFDESIALFNRIKKEVYGAYTNCTLLDEKYKAATIKYLDEFYTTINNVDAIKKEFGYPCKKNGTGNVVIKGLKEEQ
jgi:hypothetical protein